MRKTNENKGITLIALIITIIILLILAGISVAMLTGNNGILKQAKNAKDLTNTSGDKEKIILALQEKELSKNEEITIGETLYDKTIANGEKWKIISTLEDNKIYGTDWSYIAKGSEILKYGKVNESWLVNNKTEEMIKLEEGEYKELSYGANLAVKDKLVLNVDPANMSDKNSWGDGVTLYGVTDGDGYGYNGTEIKLDGVDDYIESYNKVEVEDGITFEFYGKIDKSVEAAPLISKTFKGTTEWSNKPRIFINSKRYLRMCMSDKKSESNWALPANLWADHWIETEEIKELENEDGFYITISVNLNTNTIAVYINGSKFGETTCSHEWLTSGGLDNISIPFIIGMSVGGTEYTESYAPLSIYACRLYNKVLTDSEIKENTDMTVAYHNLISHKNY